MKLLRALDGKREGQDYVSPICREKVENSRENKTAGVWNRETGTAGLVCPRCNNIVDGVPLIRQGYSGNFEPFYEVNDYSGFRHKLCGRKKNRGVCEIYAALVDNLGRVIFNLRCQDCHAVDALKTHTDKEPGSEKVTTEHIYLSSNLKERVAERPWN